MLLFIEDTPSYPVPIYELLTCETEENLNNVLKEYANDSRNFIRQFITGTIPRAWGRCDLVHPAPWFISEGPICDFLNDRLIPAIRKVRFPGEDSSASNLRMRVKLVPDPRCNFVFMRPTGTLFIGYGVLDWARKQKNIHLLQMIVMGAVAQYEGWYFSFDTLRCLADVKFSDHPNRDRVVEWIENFFKIQHDANEKLYLRALLSGVFQMGLNFDLFCRAHESLASHPGEYGKTLWEVELDVQQYRLNKPNLGDILKELETFSVDFDLNLPEDYLEERFARACLGTISTGSLEGEV
jgi:hypothetical protein